MIVNKYKNGGGGSGSGSTYTAGEYIQIAEDVISVTGITPDLYLTTADTQDLASKAYVTGITNPIQTQVDDIERVTATALTELHDAILELSGDTPDLSNYYTKAETNAAITGATQGFITSAYTGFTKTEDFDELVENLEGKEEVVASALTQLENSVLEISGSTPDLSNYYTKAETDAEITGATQGLATEAYVTAATQGFATQAYVTAATSGLASITYVDDAIEEAMTGFTPELPSYLDQEVLEAKEEVIASALTHLQNEILDISGDTPDLSNYYTSAQTEDAISAATSGKADKQNVTARESGDYWPRWNSQGVITGERQFYIRSNYVNGNGFYTVDPLGFDAITIFAPTSAGTAGDILVSTGNGAPVWTTDNKVSSTSVSTIWKGTQAQYDALATKDPNTFYIIVETQG